MFRKLLIAISTVTALAIPTFASAATFYVAKAGNGGSDSNTCTQAQNITTPKLTIANLVNTSNCLSPGDHVYIRQGTYAEGLEYAVIKPSLSGSSWATATTFEAYPGDSTVTLSGIGGCGVNGTTRYFIIKGITVSLVGISPCGNANAFADHLRLQDVTVDGNHAQNTSCLQVGGDVVGYGDYSEFLNVTVKRCGNGHARSNYGYYITSSHLTLRGGAIYDVGGFCVNNYSDGPAQPSDNLYDGILFHDCGNGVTDLDTNGDLSYFAVILASGYRNVVQNSIFYDNKNSIDLSLIDADAAYNNTITRSGNGAVPCKNDLRDCYDPIHLGNGSTNMKVKNNIIYGNWEDAIDSHGTGSGYSASNNLFTNPSWTSPGTHDYTLQSSSSAKNTGTNLTSVGVTTDYLGVSRPQGTLFDIGAYELLAIVTTRYVSLTGSNSNTGTLASPYQTIVYGVQQSTSPDDILIVRGGTYNECLNDTHFTSGTSGHPITFKNYPSETVWLQPTCGPALGFTAVKAYLVFDGISVDMVNRAEEEGIYIGYGAHHITLQNLTVKNMHHASLGGGGIQVACSNGNAHDITLTNLDVFNNGSTTAGGGVNQQHGIYIADGCTDSILEDSRIYNNAGGGLQIFGVAAGGNDGWIVRRNIFHDNEQNPNWGGASVQVGSGSNQQIYNNVVYQGVCHGTSCAGISVGYGTPDNTRVFNNTIYGFTGYAGSYFGLTIGGTATNTLVKNNIIDGGTPEWNNAGTGTVCDYNLFGDANPTGCTHSLASSNPLFRNSSIHDFTLQSTSPAKNAGVDLSSVGISTDYRGGSRPISSGFDMGAYEYGATVTFTPVDTASLSAVLARVDLICGDTYNLTPGTTYASQFTLPNVGTCPLGGVHNTIQTIPSINLPDSTTRIDPTDSNYLAIVQPTGANESAFIIPINADGWNLVNMWVRATTDSARDGANITIGTDTETNAANQPDHIVLDRLLIEGHATAWTRRGVAANSQDLQIINSYIDNFKKAGQEAQAISSWNGPGPFLFENNFLEASSQSILIGGSDPGIIGLNPSNITIRRNYMTKRRQWNPNDPLYDGSTWTVKNVFELKKGIGSLVELNIFEGAWAAAQDGTGVLYSACNQGGSDSTAIIYDAVFRYNILRNMGNPMSWIWGSCIPNTTTTRGYNVQIYQNLCYNIGTTVYTSDSGGRMIQSLSGFSHNFSVYHNTCMIKDPGGIASAIVTFSDADPKVPITSFSFKDNIVVHGLYGAMFSHDNTTDYQNNALNGNLTAGVWDHNVMAGITDSGYTTGNWSSYTPNYFPTRNEIDSQFTNISIGNFRLIPGSVYGAGQVNQASDGTDQGVNMDLIPDPTGDASGGASGAAPNSNDGSHRLHGRFGR